MKTTLLSLAPFAIILGLAVATPVAKSAAVAGQLGVFDPTNADGGINPQTSAPWAAGDQYRLAFYTSTTRDGTSANINDYNDFVQGVAAASSAFPNLGNGTWKVLGSTQAVNARENTGTVSNVAVPIYVMDGTTRIAIDSNDMWNGFTGSSGSNIRISTGNINTSPHFAPYLNENGIEQFNPGAVHGATVATGSTSGGVQVINTSNGNERYLGSTVIDSNGGNRLTWGSSNANRSGRVFQRFNGLTSSQYRFYALSDPLTVVLIPEPSMASLLGLGMIGILMRRRRS